MPAKRFALITGAAGGIGRATVDAFVDMNWEAIGVDVQQPDLSTKNMTYRKADVSNESSVLDLYDWIRGRTDRLDALINNAAIQQIGPLRETSVEQWDQLMATNLRSIFLMTREGLPLLESAQGAVVNVSSVHAVATSKGIAAYASSKGAVVALTRAMALEFGNLQIRVNAVLPGAVDTDMLREGLNREGSTDSSESDLLREIEAKTPLGRIGRPEEIAQTIAFLANPEQSSFITGQSIIADGGATAKLSTE